MKTSITAERLKQIMKERNLRQVDILKLCEPYCDKYGIAINDKLISLYVSGKRTPNRERGKVLSKALKVSEAWLMGYSITPDNIDNNDYAYYKEMAEDREYWLQEIIKVLEMEEDTLYEDVVAEVERLKRIKEQLQVLYNIAIQNEH